TSKIGAAGIAGFYGCDGSTRIVSDNPRRSVASVKIRGSRRPNIACSDLDFTFLHLIGQVLRSAPRQRHYPSSNPMRSRQRHEATAIGYEKVFDVVRLAELVEHGRLWVGAHPR